MLSIDQFSLPNLLAGNNLLPELLQDHVDSDNIITALDEIEKNGLDFYYKEFHRIHDNLRAGSSETAANEVFDLIG